jgi:hypothetical protein
MKNNYLPRLILAASVALLGCGDGTSSADMGTLTVRLADAPGEEVERAVIWVSGVSVVGDSSTYVISSDTASYDLLALQGGVTAALGSMDIPVGTYDQLRLMVDSARVTLKSPILFTNGTSSSVLKVPSGSTSGLKVNLGGVRVVPGETVLLVDFDVSRSFVFQGPPGGPRSAIFMPVIHATVMDVAGSIAGTVLPAASKAGLYAIQGTDTIATASADSLTGAYQLRYLAPGMYKVLARAVGYQDGVRDSIVVGNSQAVTGVDFTLVP